MDRARLLVHFATFALDQPVNVVIAVADNSTVVSISASAKSLANIPAAALCL
jgi:uncharacterized protein (DUF302 family)